MPSHVSIGQLPTDSLTKYIDEAENRAMQPIVITIHGIRTRGKWQKDITPFLSGFRHVALDFGWFGALSLIRRSARDRKIKWFLDEYSRRAKEGVPINVIGHSFATYVIARAIEKYPEIVFDRVIFCGAIVSVDYDWDARANQFDALLNDCGKRDFWSWVCAHFVKDAGPSGVSGFKRTANGKVENRVHADFRHSDYFYELNYKKQWVPFLEHQTVQPLTHSDKPSFNWRFHVTIAVLFSAFLIVCVCLFSWARCRDWPWDAVPGPILEFPSVTQEDVPDRELVLAPPATSGDAVRLTIENHSGNNLVVLLFACEEVYEPNVSFGNGWFQVYVPDGQAHRLGSLPSESGYHLVYAQGKCDARPKLLKCVDLYQGEYPVLEIVKNETTGTPALSLQWEPKQ